MRTIPGWRAPSPVLLAALAAAVACAGPSRNAAPAPAPSAAPAPVATAAPPAAARPPTVLARILTINDFHGQLTPATSGGRPLGGGAVVAAYLKAAAAERPGAALIVHAGDLVGASPPASALLQDEPTVALFNLLGNERCRRLDEPPSAEATAAASAAADDGLDPRWTPWLDPGCNLAATSGNHELDEGRAELLRLLQGGDHKAGPFLERPWRGARYPTMAANIADAASGRSFLPPYVVKTLGGVRVALIGLTLREAPEALTPAGVVGLTFLDEAETANRWVAALRARGVRAFVVLLHQGGRQAPYAGPTRPDPGGADLDAVARIVSRLDGDVDVVVTGHDHSFTNTWLPNRDGKPVLVTQSFAKGTAYAQIDIELDPVSGDVTAASAAIERTWGDAGPGLAPDPDAAALVAAATERVAPLVSQVVGTAPVSLRARADAAGESSLGDLVTDAQLASTRGAQVALTNPGGLRADLSAGQVTWGDLFAVQPFNNDLVAMDLTGAELLRLLEQQWRSTDDPRHLSVAGLSYAWSRAAKPGAKVRQASVGGQLLDPRATYRVVVNGFLASGGDGFTVLAEGRRRLMVGQDLEALVAYVKALPGQRIVPPHGKRITAVK